MNKPHELKEEFSDGTYSIYSLNHEGKSQKRIKCSQETICVVPFDLNEIGQIRNLYLMKYQDPLSGSDEFSCMLHDFDHNVNDSYSKLISEMIQKTFNIDSLKLDDLYYLGEVKHNLPFSKTYRCYGINLNDYLDSRNQLTTSPFGIGEIEKIRVNRAIKGELPDSLVLCCSMLLLSYFSE